MPHVQHLILPTEKRPAGSSGAGGLGAAGGALRHAARFPIGVPLQPGPRWRPLEHDFARSLRRRQPQVRLGSLRRSPP
eukprot:4191159-Pyramimonas_sp.AAC.1